MQGATLAVGLIDRRDATSRPRPALFRALGAADPPPEVEIDGESFRRGEILKHDSWAATAVYRSATRRALCKFNRRQPVLGLPMRWLGRRLAARERGFMERLAGIEGIPASLGPIRADGRLLDHAVSRAWVDGHALRHRERVDDDFFPRLAGLLAAVHARGVAHADLHKRENILVDTAGRPHLIDYQISFAVPAANRFAARRAAWLATGLFRVLARCDEYHLLKHRLRHRPDQVSAAEADLDRARPAWIRVHRRVAVPLRTCRRQLLVWLGVRDRSGQAESEFFPEVAHRPVTAAAHPAWHGRRAA
jgi:hypothetical protein